MTVARPNWNIKKNQTYSIDLSKNVHYDHLLNQCIQQELVTLYNYCRYPDEYHIYSAISNYYTIPIEQLALGFGATDIIERTIRLLNFKTLYIVSPTFEMVEVYCNLAGKICKTISMMEAESIQDSDGALYIANPNGLSGKLVNVLTVVNKFKFCIIDEVYADFDNSMSVLQNTPDNVIVIKSLSKSLGVAGLRVGFAKASNDVIKKIQEYRMNYVATSFSELLIPKIINMTSEIIYRMNKTKHFFEETYSLDHAHGNFVLFKFPNKYTDTFGAKKIGDLYRMALIDLDTLNEHCKIK
jgi:histidinol-phosphate/aromatic aminotransferase/cobyric acid decarboxylase-like protein